MISGGHSAFAGDTIPMLDSPVAVEKVEKFVEKPSKPGELYVSGAKYKKDYATGAHETEHKANRYATLMQHKIAKQTIQPEDAADSDFTKLEHKLEHQKGVTNPAALTAAIGRKELGQKEMTRRSVEGREKHEQ